jgi:hypothetical protein
MHNLSNNLSNELSRTSIALNGITRALVAIALLGTTACSGALHAGASMHGAARMAPTPVMVEPEPASQAAVSIDVRISFFGVPLDSADDVVFVLDRSGSMAGVSTGFNGRQVGMGSTTSTLVSLGGSLANGVAGGPLPSKMEAARDELIRTLRAMPDGTRFGVIFFNEKIHALSPRMWILGPDSRAQAEQFIRGVEATGTTAAVPAMRLAYRMGARRVILLSDGLANTGGDGKDLLADARRAMRLGLRIDTVGLGLDQDGALLQTVAAESGGLAVVR